MGTQEAYRTLNLSSDATSKDIKNAYREANLALEERSRRALTPADKFVRDRLNEIQRAYNVLTDCESERSIFQLELRLDELLGIYFSKKRQLNLVYEVRKDCLCKKLCSCRGQDNSCKTCQGKGWHSYCDNCRGKGFTMDTLPLSLPIEGLRSDYEWLLEGTLIKLKVVPYESYTLINEDIWFNYEVSFEQLRRNNFQLKKIPVGIKPYFSSYFDPNSYEEWGDSVSLEVKSPENLINYIRVKFITTNRPRCTRRVS